MENELQTRMYVLVNRSLSSLQKGIQALHGVVQHQLDYGETKEYLDWAKKHQTVIILDGGTSNEQVTSEFLLSNKYIGQMENNVEWLFNNKINYSFFKEPDLNNCLTAITFIVDERVYDYEKYETIPIEYFEFGINDSRYKKHLLDILGSEKNIKLREFLKQFKLAL